MKFYNSLENILQASNPVEKITLFRDFYQTFLQGGISFEEEQGEPKCFTQPSYTPICKIVMPQKVPKRKNLTTKEGQMLLLHAIAHIEYSAIDLALDAAYRFRDLPLAYYSDWLEVADDEIRHFLMIEELMGEVGGTYGDIEVHNALFEASQKTQHSFVDRMAVVPRYLEANGLDATPMIIKKINNLPKNAMLQKIVTALEVIVAEEVDHVKKGDRWFQYGCKLEGYDPKIYFDIIEKYYPRGFLRPNDLNLDARKEAGFSCSELKVMAKREVC
jgi:uncharacterized ferritin-like protein (DUF455 family)